MARIALDIDSTLHHYWDQFRAAANELHGIDLPYEAQEGWGVDALSREQLAQVVARTHEADLVEAAEPYPHAVATVRAWHDAGHFVHVTSHRAEHTAAATARWLERIALPYDDLHLSFDKVTRCVELAIDVLVDDSPVNMERAHAEGIVPATIAHPWNREACAALEGAVCAPDWPALRAALEPVLAGR